MIRILTAIFFLSLNTHMVSAETWNCRNEAIEISCGDGKCEGSKNHTPMDVSFDLTGSIKICAYSGCWQGSASSTLISGAYLVMTSDNLNWGSMPTDKLATATVSIDRTNLIATMMIENFAHPMTCKISQ